MAISCRKAFRVCEKYEFACAYCDEKPGRSNLQIDHLIPRSRGGSDDEENLVPACVACNQGKSDGFYVPPRLRLATDDDGCHVVFQQGAWAIKIGPIGAFLSGAVYGRHNVCRSSDCYEIALYDVWSPHWEDHVRGKSWRLPHRLCDFLSAFKLARTLVKQPLSFAEPCPTNSASRVLRFADGGIFRIGAGTVTVHVSTMPLDPPAVLLHVNRSCGALELEPDEHGHTLPPLRLDADRVVEIVAQINADRAASAVDGGSAKPPVELPPTFMGTARHVSAWKSDREKQQRLALLRQAYGGKLRRRQVARD